jgi:hypothetical protein
MTVQDKVGDQRASEEGAKEAGEANDHSFTPFGAKDRWIQLGAGKKGEYDGPRPSQERNPFGISQ